MYQTVNYHLKPSAKISLYDEVQLTLMIFQNAAILEIVHAFTRLVPSNPIITTFQVFSRIMVVCGVLLPTIEGRLGWGLPMALIAWSITEIIRYSYYALNIVATVPQFLIYLRYFYF